jgi:hypothetical protein
MPDDGNLLAGTIFQNVYRSTTTKALDPIRLPKRSVKNFQYDAKEQSKWKVTRDLIKVSIIRSRQWPCDVLTDLDFDALVASHRRQGAARVNSVRKLVTA